MSVGGRTETQTDTVWYSPSVLVGDFTSQTCSLALRCSEGYVKLRGHRFGLAFNGGSELSNCVGGMREEGDRVRERGRKWGGEEGGWE